MAFRHIQKLILIVRPIAKTVDEIAYPRSAISIWTNFDVEYHIEKNNIITTTKEYMLVFE
ncbi:hypothetical protein SAMD00020551_2303 [Mesobacillus selenatarsenatis SF-1]|uniref:Uncharacterized protein n=1 Tax=Mesobacillus selenatarsenatis (strain DSM 18680 / JCM 14380 / FERM P-15431 / SF-1) TaxID=1321606 RepID=A0A0A8X2D7_MESS1|nr:hypothetical protein SAMD00020551_2303 [Mesobacillus selenatarsenatis SF-1]